MEQFLWDSYTTLSYDVCTIRIDTVASTFHKWMEQLLRETGITVLYNLSHKNCYILYTFHARMGQLSWDRGISVLYNLSHKYCYKCIYISFINGTIPMGQTYYILIQPLSYMKCYICIHISHTSGITSVGQRYFIIT